MKLRGGISGFGEVAAGAHLPGWSARRDVQIVAVHDPVAKRRHHALHLVKNVRVYDDLELMLAGERLDFLDVASPPALHAQTARVALEAGTHVIVEKPLCLDLAEFDALESLAASNSRVLMCVHNWKHSPAYRLAHDMIGSGRLGALRYIALERLRTEPAGARVSRWRSDPAAGGGILIDHGWHVFYLMAWLMGDTPVETSARLGFAPGQSAEDVADVRVVFPRDRIAYCHLSWRAPERRTSAVLYGEDAILEVGVDSARLTRRSGESEHFPIADPRDDSYHSAWFAGVAEDFVSAVERGGGQVQLINLAEARTALVLILAARRSQQSQGAPQPAVASPLSL